MPRACITCDFFAPPGPTDGALGGCRRNAPALFIIPGATTILGNEPPQPARMSAWPAVTPAHWCGEWRQRCHPPHEDGAAPKMVEAPRA